MNSSKNKLNSKISQFFNLEPNALLVYDYCHVLSPVDFFLEYSFLNMCFCF